MATRRRSKASRSAAAKKGWRTRRARGHVHGGRGPRATHRRGRAKRRVCRPKVRCGYRGCYSKFAPRRKNGTLRAYKRRPCRKPAKARRRRRSRR